MTTQYTELTYKQALDLANLTPEVYVMKDEDYPRIIPNCFNIKMNGPNKRRYALFYCFSMQKGKDVFYYSPSVSLFSTLQQYDENQIRKSMGQGIDSLSEKDSLVIDHIVNLIKNPDEAMKSKRLDKILEPSKIEKLSSIGYGCNAEIKGKNGDNYVVFGKQFISVKNNLPNIPDSYEIISTNPLDLTAKSKLEFENNYFQSHILMNIVHALQDENLTIKRKVLDEPRGNDIRTVEGLFDPFIFQKLLDYNQVNLRKTVRKALTPSILSQLFIENEFKDHNPHKVREYTFFRCETDAVMLSQKAIYNPLVLDWFNNYNENIVSQLLTKQFYCEYFVTGFEINPNIQHNYNEQKKRLEHVLNDNLFITYHGLLDRRKGNNKLSIPTSLVEDISITKNFTGMLTEYTPENIKNVFAPNNYKVREDERDLVQIITHDENNNFTHLVKRKDGRDEPINNNNIQVVHLKKKWQPMNVTHNPPRTIAALPNNVLISIKPYQMMKYNGQSSKSP